MNNLRTAAKAPLDTKSLLEESYDFSLVLGGPLYQLYCRSHLSGTALDLLRRRVVVICLFAWLPLLVLSVFEGNAWGSTVRVPFLLDVGAHVRFLVSLPLFIIAELFVHERMRHTVKQFIVRGLVSASDRWKLEAAVASALRWRNSALAEVLLLIFVYLVGVLVLWRTQFVLRATAWYALPAGGTLRSTFAGWWFIAVSLPLFQFILMRWCFRLLVWMRFLWQVSRIELRLVPTHPDLAGGLGFLGTSVHAFALILLGQGSLLAGWIANRIFFDNASLPDFKLEMLVSVILLLLITLGPLLVFTPQLAQTKHAGLREYGALASRYVSEFDRKWLRGGATPEETLVGSSDIQSLADMGNSFDVVRSMRLVPFGKETLILLVAMILGPVLPLTLTMIPLNEILNRLLKVLF